jgi:4-carboxymuconolactone decarboxylase
MAIPILWGLLTLTSYKMNKIFHIAVLTYVALPFSIMAQNAAIFPKGEKSPNVHHTGNVWLKELNGIDSIFNNSIAAVTMEAGSRLNWHKHPGGQILMIIDGLGYYQEKGKPKETVGKGEVIKCLPDVEHWHGATPDSDVTYIASSPTQKGRTIWLEKVTDEAYFGTKPAKSNVLSKEEYVLQISKDKWRLMAERNVDSLAMLFNEKSVFVHMGGNMTKEQELDVIKTGRIQYKQTEIHETSVQVVSNTAIVLNKIRLTAVVGGNEVVNPFTVTEVYIFEDDKWSLASLSFTRLLAP